MRKGWEIKKLGVICENLDSKRIPITQSKRNKGEYPYYGASGIVDYVADYIFDDDLLLVSEDGANLLARTYPIAFPISGKVWVNNHAHVLKFENSTKQKLIEYYLNSIKLDAFVSGMAQPKLNQAMLNSIPIPVPPIPEQQRIVAILDEAFEAIDQAKANTEKNLQNAKELFQSELNSIFTNKGEGWVEKKLGDVLQKTETINPLRQAETEFIYIDVSSVNKETLLIEDVNFIKGKDAPSRARKFIKTNDVIFATVRPTLKRIAIIPEEYNEQICSTGYFVLRASDMIDYRMLFYYLQTFYFQDKMEKLQKGASYPAVTDNEVRQQIINFPTDKKVQQGIVHQLDALSSETKKLEENYRKKLESLEELKKSILQKAFSGELTSPEEALNGSDGMS